MSGTVALNAHNEIVPEIHARTARRGAAVAIGARSKAKIATARKSLLRPLDDSPCLLCLIGLAGLAALFAGSAARAAEPPALLALASGDPGVVVEAVDGDTVVLADGREIRLLGIQAPKLPLGRKDFPAWPLSDKAKAWVEDLILGAAVTPRFGTRRADRHGRVLAHLLTADGTWIQGAILRAGMARVYTFPDNRLLAAEMYGLERAARDARRGVWADDWYVIRAPESVLRDLDTFQIVDGEILSAKRVRDRIYLNFGWDWRTDFTVKIPNAARRLFRKDKIDPLSWEGRRVRVRGWVHFENGAMITLSHPEPLELLD